MQRIYKQRQRTKRAADEAEMSVETEMSVPTTSLTDTSDAAELVAAIDEILGG